MLLAPGIAQAQFEPAPPTMCVTAPTGCPTCNGTGDGLCTIATSGPTQISCGPGGGQTCSALDYSISCDFDQNGRPDRTIDHTEIGLSADKEFVAMETTPSSVDVSDPCEGGLVSNGFDCSERVVTFNNASTKNGPFTVAVLGDVETVTKGVCVKKGNKRECCAVAGFGRFNSEFGKQEVQSSTFKFEGATFQINPTTGALTVLDGELYALFSGTADQTSIAIEGFDAGQVQAQFGDTQAKLGDSSCGYQFFQGRVYLVCSCLPNTTDVCSPFELGNCPSGTVCGDR